jgi:hypothetical protein
MWALITPIRPSADLLGVRASVEAALAVLDSPYGHRSVCKEPTISSG